MIPTKIRRLLPLLLIALLPACKNRSPRADLEAIYGEAARYEHPARNPVIVIPGILGSKLENLPTGTSVWGVIGSGGAHPGRPATARMLALPMAKGQSLANLRDEVVATGALDTVKLSLIPGLVNLSPKAYAQILITLGAAGYKDQSIGDLGTVDYGDDHYTCFQFGYDWRRSNVENAASLARFIEEKSAFVKAQNIERFGRSDEVRFDIVAHSMGGLLTRYFLRYGDQSLPASGGLPELNWAGAAVVDRAIIVGTPNAGSIISLEYLTAGMKPAPILPRFSAAILGTMPAIYELIPRARHRPLIDSQTGTALNPLNADLWLEKEWGLANPEQDEVLRWLLPGIADLQQRRQVAHDHIRKSLANARQFQQAIDLPATPPEHLRLSLHAGDAVATPTSAFANPRIAPIAGTAPGDGTVTRASALMDENVSPDNQHLPSDSPIAWDDVNFLFKDHLGLTKDPTFADNVLFELLKAAPR